MLLTITVKAEAESRGELIDTFADQVENLRGHFEALKAENALGDPSKITLRYLVIGGQWREPARQHGEPSVEV